MKRNMSDLDRIIRVIVAAVFGYLYFAHIVSGVVGIILLVVAIVFVLTAIVAFCPLYVPLKFSTYKS